MGVGIEQAPPTVGEGQVNGVGEGPAGERGPDRADVLGIGDEGRALKVWRIFLKGWAIAGIILFASSALWADAPKDGKKATPVLLDTDIGTDVDDAFALALVLASPELELCGVTTVGSEPR